MEILPGGQAKKMRDDVVHSEEMVKIGILRVWDSEVNVSFWLRMEGEG